jgi:catechol 2,3-dioxygenase-like lactoylglutathione lyase family enzyme
VKDKMSRKLMSVTPRLKTTDLTKAIKFYADTLGLEPGVLWPKERPTFCILGRDGVQVGFSQAKAASPIELYIEVESVVRWHGAVKDKVTIEWGPEVYSYGRREFAFRDPDGNLVILTERTLDPPTCVVE